MCQCLGEWPCLWHHWQGLFWVKSDATGVITPLSVHHYCLWSFTRHQNIPIFNSTEWRMKDRSCDMIFVLSPRLGLWQCTVKYNLCLWIDMQAWQMAPLLSVLNVPTQRWHIFINLLLRMIFFWHFFWLQSGLTFAEVTFLAGTACVVCQRCRRSFCTKVADPFSMQASHSFSHCLIWFQIEYRFFVTFKIIYNFEVILSILHTSCTIML